LPDKPETREVPLELIEQTLGILLNLTVNQGYRLAKAWEEIHPDFFKPGSPGMGDA
jgi:hypothetical protein